MPDIPWSNSGVFIPRGWASPDSTLVGLDSSTNAQFTPQAGYKYIVVGYASTADVAAIYDNVSAGVGATLTATSNGVLAMDGGNPAINTLVLVKDQTNTFENGVYVVTDPGTAGTPFVLTRYTGFDEDFEIPVGIKIKVIAGTVNANSNLQQTATVATIGTDAITFALDGLLDENNMASDSDTKGATQQSIKAYVDAFIPSYNVVQSITTSISTGASTSSVIPFDNTVPQITEGAQFTNVSITPTDASNIIVIEVFIPIFTVSSQGTIVFQTAIFEDPNTDALVASYGGTYNQNHNVRCEVVAGSTSARTYTFRFGTAGSGTAYCNTSSLGVVYGGANVATMTATEYKV